MPCLYTIATRRLLLARRLSPQHTRFASKMPTKRKAPEQEPPASMPINSRRTSRRLKDAADSKDTDETKRRWSSKEGVERAMRELGEMEEKFQQATRTQRMAVESSDLSFEQQEPHVFQSSPIWSAKSVVNQKQNPQPTKIETAPQEDYEAELAQGDLVEAKAADDGAERGAARPPPVNSDTLPLPWKGRLGYVGLLSSITLPAVRCG
jgi:UV DNA damage endonuclease